MRIVQTAISVRPNPRRDACIAIILALGLCLHPAFAIEPPPDLAKRVAIREAETEAERANYTYRQIMVEEELDDHGGRRGEYREVRDIVFSPEGQRTEQLVGKPSNSLKRLKLTEEDFRDLRDVQPYLFTPDQLFMYEVKFRGDETVDGVDSWLLQVRPRQLLQGQRLFDGQFWIDKRDFSIVRSEGQAVPQIRSTKAEKENLFPHFTTVREKFGNYWFPVHTHADDTLYFMSGAQRIRLTVRYSQYKRFGAESKILPLPPQ